MQKRCAWVANDSLYLDYHDQEWGVPIFDKRKLFEFLILETMQAGLNWLTILKKRESFRQAFADFDPIKLAKFNAKQIENLLQNPNIIRNRLKINSVIKNAKAYLAIEEHMDFSEYMWQFVEGKPITNHHRTAKSVPTKTKISDQMTKDLKKRGFSFVGSTTCYALMQAVGMVNDHEITCFRYAAVKAVSAFYKK